MRLPFHIHEYLRASRFDTRVPRALNVPRGVHKEYLRLPRVALPNPSKLDMPLSDVLAARRSWSTEQSPLTLKALSTILYESLSANSDGRRRYPSGGALYPIETYLVSFSIPVLSRSVYHYHPSAHALEQLWELPEGVAADSIIKDVKPEPAALLIFTGMWEKSCQKYGDFGYYLSMLEVGHMAQNIVLTSTALRSAATPLGGGFSGHEVSKLLDIDSTIIEQPVYAIQFA